jgi:ribonuclease J
MSFKIRVFALGGLDEHGKCMLGLELNQDIFVVEAGLKYPDRSNPGIDAIIPNFEYLIKNRHRVRAYIITHGHDDQFGALPYMYQQVPAPVYGTKATLALLNQFAQENHLQVTFQQQLIQPTSLVDIAGYHFHFFQTVHSVMDSCGFSLDTPYGNIVYSGDFIVEYNTSKNYKHDLNALAKIAEKETLLLLTESVSADRPGYCSPNHRLKDHLVLPFQMAQGRIFIALYNQSVYNLEEVIKFAIDQNKKIIFYDLETENYIKTFVDLGSLSLPKERVVARENHLRTAIRDEVIIMMGQGEKVYKKMDELANNANEDKTFVLSELDSFIVACPSAPAFEVLATDAVDGLYQTGAKVTNITRKQIRSMHAQEEDIKTFISLLKPKYYLPMKGEYVHLVANAKLAISAGTGLTHTNTFLMDNGHVLEFTEGKPRMLTHDLDKIATGDVLIDGLGVGDVKKDVIVQRQRLAEDGIVILGATLSKVEKTIIAGPDIQMRGFIFVKESENIIKEVTQLFQNELQDYLTRKFFLSLDDFKLQLIDKVSKVLRRINGKNPVILPLIYFYEAEIKDPVPPNSPAN